MITNKLPANIEAEFLLYTTSDKQVEVDVPYQGETIWLQKRMGDLFVVQVPAINNHLINIFENGEFLESAVISILETTAAYGKSSGGR